MEHLILQGAVGFLKTHRNILLIMEKKYQALDAINDLLALTGKYECLPVDEYNIAYKKI